MLRQCRGCKRLKQIPSNRAFCCKTCRNAWQRQAQIGMVGKGGIPEQPRDEIAMNEIIAARAERVMHTRDSPVDICLRCETDSREEELALRRYVDEKRGFVEVEVEA